MSTALCEVDDREEDDPGGDFPVTTTALPDDPGGVFLPRGAVECGGDLPAAGALREGADFVAAGTLPEGGKTAESCELPLSATAEGSNKAAEAAASRRGTDFTVRAKTGDLPTGTLTEGGLFLSTGGEGGDFCRTVALEGATGKAASSCMA